MAIRCSGAHKGPIQQVTATCQACGRNIYETDMEYEQDLDKVLESARKKHQGVSISLKEAELRGYGIL